MSGLNAYQDRRLELADMIRAALHLARGTGDEDAEQRARDLLARLAAGRFQLAVAGQVSRGKTTLMNALLGGAYLPMGALPVTSVITTVRYGSRPRAMVRRRASALSVEVPLAEVDEFVAQASTRRAETQVVSVQVEVPAEILRRGIEFIDTPGVGSAVETATAATRQFLPEADAVIFVTGFDSPLTGTEAGFVADVAGHAGQLFVVVNKRDLVSDRDAAEVLESARRYLREDLSLPGPFLFGMSAREALEAVIDGDRERWCGSGLPQFHAALAEFLMRGKAQLFLRNVADRAARLVSGQRRDLRLGRLVLDGGPEPSVVLAEFSTRMDDLERQMQATVDKITGKIETSLPGLLAARSPAWQASLLEELEPCAGEALSAAAGDGSVRAVLENSRGRLERAGREVARSWLKRRAGVVHELVTGLVAAEIGRLLELSRSPGAVGAEIAHVNTSDDRPGPGGWSADKVPNLAVPVPEWTVPLKLPRRSGRKTVAGDAAIRRNLTEALATAISVFEASGRSGFQRAAESWAGQLGDQAVRQAREAAARFRRCLATVPREEDMAALADLATRIAGFQAALGARVPAPGADIAAGSQLPAASVQGDAGDAADCVVCEQMEAALTDHLRRDQFRLATRERDQGQHARAGGFCPAHTWQYAAIASPVGISAGYAKLAAAMADALESISRPGSAASDLARRVAALTPQDGTCPLCAALAERERTAIIDIISQAPAEAAAVTLCLRHLGRALAAGPAPETGRAMLRALAAALRRDSEDMRAYALKREARHGGLITDEESRAHLDALRRLAGLSALAPLGN